MHAKRPDRDEAIRRCLEAWDVVLLALLCAVDYAVDHFAGDTLYGKVINGALAVMILGLIYMGCRYSPWFLRGSWIRWLGLKKAEETWSTIASGASAIATEASACAKKLQKKHKIDSTELVNDLRQFVAEAAKRQRHHAHATPALKQKRKTARKG